MNEKLVRTVRAALGPEGSLGATRAFWVPGRIEVLGKHTDYAGGRSLVCAVEQGFAVAAAPRSDSLVRIVDVAEGSEATLALDALLPEPVVAWMRYPATVLRRIARNFPGARRGADLAFVSDLPPASGMSSSSAFMVAVFLAVAALNDIEEDPAYRATIQGPEELAGYLATVENGQSFGGLTGDRGVGTFGGSEDHTAMLCCRPGELSQYSFCPVRHERQFALPARYRFVVAVSGVRAEKTGAAMESYNRASLAVRAILDAWRRASGRADRSLAEAVEKGGAAEVREVVERSAVDGFDTQALLDRLDQFVEESFVITPAAGTALEVGDESAFGRLVDRSQELAERRLKNQVPETVHLARTARRAGAIAASAFGAGFGGSVWAMIEGDRAQGFIAQWEREFRAEFPLRQPSLIVTRPGCAAGQVK